MPSIAITPGNQYMYVALEDVATTNQVIVRALLTDLATWTEIFNIAGTAINVKADTVDSDVMYFYGSFGVRRHSVASDSEVDISPAVGLFNTLVVQGDDIYTILDVGQDLYKSGDQGATWNIVNSATQIDGRGMFGLFSGQYELDRLFWGGTDTVNAKLFYTPNEGATLTDVTGGLTGATSVVDVDCVA